MPAGHRSSTAFPRPVRPTSTTGDLIDGARGTGPNSSSSNRPGQHRTQHHWIAWKIRTHKRAFRQLRLPQASNCPTTLRRHRDNDTVSPPAVCSTARARARPIPPTPRGTRMARYSRREFLRTGLATGALVGAGSLPLLADGAKATDWITLGKSGVKVTRLAFGTGSHGGSVQRNLGQDGFTALVRHAYDRDRKSTRLNSSH